MLDVRRHSFFDNEQKKFSTEHSSRQSGIADCLYLIVNMCRNVRTMTQTKAELRSNQISWNIVTIWEREESDTIKISK